jgi:hypothetical protein
MSLTFAQRSARVNVGGWRRLANAALLTAICHLLAGCATTTLDGIIIRGERPARLDELGAVRVLRGGAPVGTQLNMVLQPGDEIATGADAYALIHYPSGTEVYLRPNSRVRIGSLFAFISELFVKVKGAFSVETEFVTAGAEGTGYLVQVPREGDATVIVSEGIVTVSSKTVRWPSMRLGPGEKVITQGQGTPIRTKALPEELQETARWVETVKRLVPTIPIPREPPYRSQTPYQTPTYPTPYQTPYQTPYVTPYQTPYQTPPYPTPYQTPYQTPPYPTPYQTPYQTPPVR